MDFAHKALADGRPFRVLTIVDNGSVRVPCWGRLPACRVLVSAPRRISLGDRRRASATVDHRRHGTTFMSRALEDWGASTWRVARLHSTWKAVKNAFIESFNGRLWDEYLDVHQCTPIEDAKAMNRTGFFGGLIPREDGAHGTSQ